MMVRRVTIILVASVLAACQSAAPPPLTVTAPHIPAEETVLSEGRWQAFDWSPDGKRLVLIQPNFIPLEAVSSDSPPYADGSIAIVEVESGEQTEVPQPGIAALWSADGSSLMIYSVGAQGDDQQLWLYWLADHRLLPLPELAGRPQVWTGDRLLYDTPEGLSSVPVKIADPITLGEPERVARYHLEHAQTRWIYPAPDLNTFLIHMGLNQTANKPNARWWLDSADGASTEISAAVSSIGTCCAWSPDSQHLALFVNDPERALSIMDRTGDNFRVVLRGSDIGDGAFISMDFSPSGEFIVFEWSDEGEGFPFSNNQIYLVNVETGAWRRITERSGTYSWLDWSPTGNVIAYLNDQDAVSAVRIDEP